MSDNIELADAKSGICVYGLTALIVSVLVLFGVNTIATYFLGKRETAEVCYVFEKMPRDSDATVKATYNGSTYEVSYLPMNIKVGDKIDVCYLSLTDTLESCSISTGWLVFLSVMIVLGIAYVVMMILEVKDCIKVICWLN